MESLGFVINGLSCEYVDSIEVALPRNISTTGRQGDGLSLL